MKTWQILTAAAAAVVLGLGTGVTVAATAAPPSTLAPIAAPAATVDATVAEQLTYIRDEERLARDLYLAIAELYPDTTAFSRIAVSEQRHFDSVGGLLTRYGLTDPSAGREVGDYADAGLTQMYDQLLSQAKASVHEAYKVGVAFEVTDIADLETSLAGNLPADARKVLTNLLAGSNNHLAAFTALRDGESVGIGTGAEAHKGRDSRRADGTHHPSNTHTGTGHGRRDGREHGVGMGTGTQNGRGEDRADCTERSHNSQAGAGHGRRGAR